jgi:hypothetical protein
VEGHGASAGPRPYGGADWALQDIHALSYEIAEWADDPFVNNTVQPWLTPTAPQHGCTGILETGDPVVDIGIAMGMNTFQQGPNPNGTQAELLGSAASAPRISSCRARTMTLFEAAKTTPPLDLYSTVRR